MTLNNVSNETQPRSAKTDMNSDHSNIVYYATYAEYIKILAIQNFAVAEVTLQVHPRSSETTWFDKGHTISY